MAIRIVGVDLPQNKRGEIALTYIYGIGRSSSAKILDKAGVDRDLKVKDWTDDQAAKIREIIGAEYKVEHQTFDGYRLLSRHSSPFGTSCERTEHQEQCSHAQGKKENCCKQEKSY